MSRRVSRPCGVDIVYFDGGGAHRSAAFALRDALLKDDAEADVRVLDTDHVFRGARPLRNLLGAGIQVYNASLRHETVWFGDLRNAMRLGTWMVDRLTDASVEPVSGFFAGSAPRVLVSFVPMIQRLMMDALQRERPQVRGLVVPVDFKEIVPGYWFDRTADVDYFCGTDRLVSDAAAAGISKERIRRVDGMVVHPKFSALSALDLAGERARLGLDPALPTVLLFFGGQGSRRMIDMAKELDASPLPMNLLIITGRDHETFRLLSQWTSRNRKHVVGYADNVERLMRVADVLVGKPGPVSVYEALACNLPMVLWDNPAFGVLFDENLRWVRAEGAGLSIRHVDELPAAVARIIGSPTFKKNATRLRGKATADVVASIHALLEPPKVQRPRQLALVQRR